MGSTHSHRVIERSTFTSISIFYSNVTFWGVDVEEFYSKDTSLIQMAVEHRLDEAMFQPVLRKMTAWKRKPFIGFAERTGSHALATSGGQMILPRTYLHCTNVDPALVSFVVDDASTALRWTAMVLRTKSVSILLVLIYLNTGEGLSDRNLQMFKLVHFSQGKRWWVVIGR